MTKSHLALVAPTTVNGTVDEAGPPQRRTQRRGPRARVPDRRRGQSADLGSWREPPWPPRRHHGAGRLPPWLAGGRAGHAALGRHRFCPWPPACEPAQGQRRSRSTRCPAASCGRYAGSSASRTQLRRSSSRPSAARHSRPAGFRKMIARLGVAADFGFPVHPHMLRHACGFKLANDGVDTRSLQAYLGPQATSSTRCATPSWRRPASRTSGAIDRSR